MSLQRWAGMWVSMRGSAWPQALHLPCRGPRGWHPCKARRVTDGRIPWMDGTKAFWGQRIELAAVKWDIVSPCWLAGSGVGMWVFQGGDRVCSQGSGSSPASGYV